MKRLIALGCASAIASLLSFTAVAGDDSWGTDFEQAKQASAKTGRTILVDFSGSDWCGWCMRLDQEVFSQQAFKDYAKENLVLFLADFPKGKEQSEEVKKQNDKLAKRYNVTGFPTVLLLDAKGKELARTGYLPGGAEAYVKQLESLLKEADKE